MEDYTDELLLESSFEDYEDDELNQDSCSF